MDPSCGGFDYKAKPATGAMKDYDAIARGAQEDDTWSIFSVRYDKDGKPWRFEITGGINGEGPAYTVGVIEGKERAEEICKAHNDAILRKHDEAEAGGKNPPRGWPNAADVIDIFEKHGTVVPCPTPTDEKALRALLQRMTNRSNRITCPFRHEHDVRAIRADDIESLYEAQLEAESILARDVPKEQA